MAELFLGEFRFDTRRLVLEGPAGAVAVRPKTLEVLTYLIAHRNRFVSRRELMRELWPDVRVTDASVTQCISELRSALNDSARSPRYIETRVRHGYRFIATLYHKPTERLEPLPPPPEPSGGPESRAWPRNRSLLAAAGAVLAVLFAAVTVRLLPSGGAQGPTPVRVFSVATAGSGERATALADAVRTGILEAIRSDPDFTAPARGAPAERGLEAEITVRETATGRLETVAVLRKATGGKTLWGWTWIVPRGSGSGTATADRIAGRILEAARRNRR